MDLLHWELSVLTRCVAFQNLTQASQHIGISQPQLSRIVSRLEHAFETTLLDRDAKRKASWTPMAIRLAEVYSKSERHLTGEIQGLLQQNISHVVKVGTLEGLGTLALGFGERILRQKGIEILELDIFDLNELEENFMKGLFDFIFTFRQPARKKFKNVESLGFQALEKVGSDKNLQVLSEFEYTSSGKKRDPKAKYFVSNSLELRKIWIKEHGGQGIIPGPLHSQKNEKDEQVLLIGSDILPESLWRIAVSFNMKRG